MSASDPDWWRGAVIYQIYPRSFQDSTGDGVGDLDGIAARLDHVADLGADAVWICPFFRSPMKDFGYDVSDYGAVDPVFGDLAALDRVVERAHALGLRVLIDQVWSHTSDEHPWFLESRASREGPRAGWYVWADARPDGGPPNNWLSVFGGGAWTWEPRRRQYYLHHFLPSQPALDLRREAVLAALLDAGRSWLERGVDGFRLDAVDFMLHDPRLHDNPPRARPPGAPPPLKPFAFQALVHDMMHVDTMDVVARIRAFMDGFPGGRATVAEVSSEEGAFGRSLAYTAGGGRRLHMAYTLRLMRGAFDPAAVRAAIADVERARGEGWICWSFSNHDVERVASRWGRGRPGFAAMLLALLVSLPGSVSLYQGEELGLPEAALAREDLRDPFGIAFYPEFKGRDGCRTPLPWEARAPGAGFTSGRPWLPIPDEHRALAVDAQRADPASTLATARRLLRFRRERPGLRVGPVRLLETAGDAIA
ncbi:MAG TPA: alpha-amylase family glycosyl hydrolase, partial [Planctomycetota bacterium]|nr:alpha-amylase family glycosyl hydrolase [Planctomycetota bacterium]